MKGKLLGPLEEKIMQIFWQGNCQSSIRDLHRALSKTSPLAYTTAATVVGRLVEKGLLRRRRKGTDYIYQCLQTEEEFLATRSRGLIKGLLDNFGELAIASFVDEVKDDPQSLQKLKELANER